MFANSIVMIFPSWHYVQPSCPTGQLGEPARIIFKSTQSNVLKCGKSVEQKACGKIVGLTDSYQTALGYKSPFFRIVENVISLFVGRTSERRMERRQNLLNTARKTELSVLWAKARMCGVAMKSSQSKWLLYRMIIAVIIIVSSVWLLSVLFL